MHESGRSRFQDGELDRARGIVGDRAWIRLGHAGPFADNTTLECRRTGYPVLPDDGGVAIGPAVLFPVAVLPDDHPDTPGSLRSTSCRAARHLCRACGPGRA